jgi:putative membrane protein
MTNVKFMSVLVLGSMTLAPAFAQDQMRKMENGPSTYKITSLDQLVLSKIHHADTVEIKAAKLALQRSQSPEVKSVAHQIIKDHTDADVQVMEVAKADSIRLLVPLLPQNGADKKAMAEHKSQMAALQKLHGAAFDADYQKLMISAHQRDLAELTDAQPKLQNENTRSLVAKLIPQFEHHEQILAQIDLTKDTKTAKND